MRAKSGRKLDKSEHELHTMLFQAEPCQRALSKAYIRDTLRPQQTKGDTLISKISIAAGRKQSKEPCVAGRSTLNMTNREVASPVTISNTTPCACPAIP